MKAARKITVEVPRELLERAQRASDGGITQTVTATGRGVAGLLAVAPTPGQGSFLAHFKGT